MTAHAAEKVVFSPWRHICRSAERLRSSNSAAHSAGELVHPVDITVHPLLKEFLTACANVAGIVEQSLRYVDEGLRLAECRCVQVCENVAQMLLGQCGADGTNGSTEDTGGLARPGLLGVQAGRAVLGGPL